MDGSIPSPVRSNIWQELPLSHAAAVQHETYELAGATYWQIPANLTSGPFDRVASLWFATAVAVLQPAANASSIINMEKDVLRRELSNGMYRFSSFYIAKGLTSLPFQLFFATIFTVGVYFSVGYQATALKFFAFFLIVILLMLISETMGTAAGAIHRSPPVGLILVSAICLLLMMYTGFIQTHTPVYFVWLKKVSGSRLHLASTGAYTGPACAKIVSTAKHHAQIAIVFPKVCRSCQRCLLNVHAGTKGLA